MPFPHDPNWGPSPLIGFSKTLEELYKEQKEAMQEVRLYNLRCAEAIGALIFHNFTLRRWEFGAGWNVFTQKGIFVACDEDLLEAIKEANARMAAWEAEKARIVRKEEEEDV